MREACTAELEGSPPNRVIAVGISPPRGDGDDDAWESLCKVFAKLSATKVGLKKAVAKCAKRVAAKAVGWKFAESAGTEIGANGAESVVKCDLAFALN